MAHDQRPGVIVMQRDISNMISYKKGRWVSESSNIISERPVTLMVNNEFWLIFMCTPVDLEALGVGFLFNENIIQSVENIASVRVCSGGEIIDVWLNMPVKKPEKWILTSGCSGGETSIQEKRFVPGFINHQNIFMLGPNQIERLMDKLLKSQVMYRKSGGVHTSILCDGDEVIFTAEDIGRHNTLDKLSGKCLLEQVVPDKPIILSTGRISSEMILKASRIGTAIIISRTSPTSLSIQMAEELSITLIGYARHDQFAIYTHPERILSSDERILIEAQ
jgi:FdhD protein